MKTEKQLLESTLESLKAKHLEELRILEDSYRYHTSTATQTKGTCFIVTDCHGLQLQVLELP